MAFKKNQLIYGRHPVIDAIQSGQSLDKLLLQLGIRGPFEREIRQLGKKFNIPVQIVPKEKLEKLARGNHQGIVGFLSLLSYYSLGDVLPGLFEKGETPLLLLLDGITDVRNFGAVARSAEICGVHALIIPKKGAAQINAEALKASAGALMNITVCRESSLIAAIEYLEQSGVQIVASDLQADRLLYEIDFKLPTAIIMGSEDQGVHASILRQVQQRFMIPQRGTTDSFNVSVATGIILYEAMRQRG